MVTILQLQEKVWCFMTYQEVKVELDSAKQNLVAKHNELKRLGAEVTKLSSEKDNLHSVYERRILDARKKAAQESRQAAMAPIESKLNEAELQLEKTKLEYDSIKKDLTFDSFYQKYSSRQEILDEVKDSVGKLRERIQDTLGESFLQRLYSSMEEQQINLEGADLERLIRYFNQCSAKVDSFADKPNSILSFVFSVEHWISDNATAEEQNKTSLAIISLFLVIITFFAYKFVFPVYVVLIAVMAIYNMLCSYNIFKILIVQKAVQDNIDSIEKLLRDMIQEDLDNQIRETDSKYSRKLSVLESNINSLREQLSLASVKSEYSFEFDPSALEKEEELAVQRLAGKESDLLLMQQTVKQEYQEWTEKANSLKKKLNEIVGGIQTDYLNFSEVCLDTIFDPRFLFDIDTAKSKPIYFEHPETSCLFLYRDYEDVTDFVRLLCVQLRSKINPFNLSITIIDTVNIGQSFVYFLPTQTKKGEDFTDLFRIISDESDVTEKFSMYNEDMKRRQKNITKEFSNIAEYNKFMLNIDSLTEGYDFLFVLDPNDDVFTNSDFMRVLRNGGSLGIYGHVFVKLDKFAEMGDSAKSLLEFVEKTYLLQNGNFNERAKDFILDQCFKKD